MLSRRSVFEVSPEKFVEANMTRSMIKAGDCLIEWCSSGSSAWLEGFIWFDYAAREANDELERRKLLYHDTNYGRLPGIEESDGG